MLIGNHSGGVPFDGMMVLSSLFFDKDPPRHAHGMVEKFAQRLPVVAPFFTKTGQFNGIPANAIRLLEQERLLMVFPEGIRGIAKHTRHRYQLQRFGTGFMRIALETGAPIVPFAFIGGEEAFPTVAHIRPLAKLLGVPYFPVPRHILPIPLPRPCSIRYSEPMHFEGNGRESDELVKELVGRVTARIAELFEEAGKTPVRRDAPGATSARGTR
jgi:1-acyl-sn-glycerol-3-phosphate acyltransferase